MKAFWKEDDEMYYLFAIVIGYFFGCINGSQLIGKWKQVNMKSKGTKNAGATNTAVVLGVRYGIIVAFIDIVKTIVSLSIVAMVMHRANMITDVATVILFINGLFVVVGHNYPITMRFQGGKGTASLFGVLLYFDWRLAVLGFIILLIFSVVSNYFVIGTFMLYASFMLHTLYVFGRLSAMIAFLFLSLFFIRHMENFKRIISKEEVTLTSLYRREAS